MSWRKQLAALVLAAAVIGLGGFAPAHAAPLEAYARLPSIENVEISPDGSRVAYLVSDGELRGVVVRELADGSSRTYGVGDSKVRWLDWVGRDHLIITASQTGTVAGAFSERSEYYLAYQLDLTTQKLRPLLAYAPGKSTMNSKIRDRDSGRIAAALNILAGPPLVRTVGGTPKLFLRGYSIPNDRSVLTIFEIDLKTGAPHLVEIGDRYTNDIVLDPSGSPVARTTYNSESGAWVLRLRQGGAWKESRSVVALNDRPSIAGLGKDGSSILVWELGDDGYQLREVAADGSWGEPLDIQDADGLVFDPETHRLIGLYDLNGEEDRYTFFDPADQKAWNAVRAAFKGDRVLLRSWTNDRKKIVVLADSPVEGPAYAMVDLDARSANWLGARHSLLQPGDISKVRPVRFKAADGLELGGYLTLPNGREAKNLPLVVLPHGGPQSRDTPGFDWWAQAVASRGYAVLRLNFRGSSGLGRSFVEAGYGQWGRKMQIDLSDGVRQLAAEGVIDPKRVCIMGASYGGYAALAGATLDTGVYRCAVAISGISDLRRMVEDEGAYAKRYWKRFMGVSSLRDPVLAEISPLNHVDKVSIPILMIHGRDDTVVPVEQSQIMADALRRAGKPHELLIQKGEDHWLSRGETRLEMLKAAMAFVETHNPPN